MGIFEWITWLFGPTVTGGAIFTESQKRIQMDQQYKNDPYYQTERKQQVLREEIEKLQNDISQLRANAKYYNNNKQKTKALECMRSIKRKNTQINRKENQIEYLEKLNDALHSAKDQADMSNMISAANEELKKYNTNINIDNVIDNKQELEESLQVSEQITNILSTDIQKDELDKEIENDDLEKELEALCNAEQHEMYNQPTNIPTNNQPTNISTNNQPTNIYPQMYQQQPYKQYNSNDYYIPPEMIIKSVKSKPISFEYTKHPLNEQFINDNNHNSNSQKKKEEKRIPISNY